MGRIDRITRKYLSDNRIFADAFNYRIFRGAQVVNPENLNERDTSQIFIPPQESIEHAGRRKRMPRQTFRDVLKGWCAKEDDKASYVMLGIESQEKVSYAMPVRSGLYDFMQYADQIDAVKKAEQQGAADGDPKRTSAEFLSGFRRSDRLKPVITLVIYWGNDAWDGPRELLEMLPAETDPQLMKFINNYKINLLAPSEIPEEDFSKFHTDLGRVLAYIKDSSDKNRLNQKIEAGVFDGMEEESGRIASLLTGSELKMKIDKDGKVEMCKAIREMREESREAGRKVGREEGIRTGRKEGIRTGRIEGIMQSVDNLRNNGFSLEEACRLLQTSVVEYEKNLAGKIAMQ